MILVFSIPRSGSTYYSEKLSRLHNHKYDYEFFHSYVPLETKRTIYERLLNGEFQEHIIKVSPYQIMHTQESLHISGLLNDLVIRSDEIHLLYRKNFTEQCKSFLAANTMHELGIPDAFFSRNQDIVCPYSEKEYYITADGLKMQIYAMANFYKKSLPEYNKPYKLVAYEDFAKPSSKYKSVKWDIVPPEITDFDPESLFK